MATVTKDFKIKYGLVVEGTTATVNNFSILTKSAADQEYIVGLIGGTSTSANTANTVVKRDASGNFAAGTITANLTGNVTGTVSSLSNHDTADLAENATNKYFTDARAITATAASYDVIGAAAAAQSAAISAAATDATTKANAAQSAAISAAATDATTKANAAQSAATTAAATDATTKANAAQAAAEATAASALSTHSADTTDVHGIANTALLATTANVATAKTEAIDAAASASTSAISAAIATEVTNRNSAISTAVDNLVDGAPALLNTLNELAAAINDDANYTTTITTALGTKAPLASPALTGVPTAPTAAANTDTTQIATTAFAKAEADAAQSAAEATASADATTKANAAQSAAASDATTKANNAKSGAEATAAAALAAHEADTTNVHGIADTSLLATTANVATAKSEAISAAATDATTKANAAQTAAIAYADALTTSDIAEGSNLYHTSARAKTAAAELLTGATLTNITITGTGSGLTITAENGVADSTTTNLAEGTNLYFTDARARSAVDGTARSFTTVEINSLAKQVAATLSVPTASASNVAYAFPKATYRSAEFLVKTAYGAHTEISKVLVTLDTSDNIAITEYGTIGTNGASMTISAGISGANVQLLVTTANNSSTIYVVGTLLA